MEATQVIAVAAFLRVINAIENIRSAVETAEFKLDVRRFRTARDLLRLAIAEVDDGSEVQVSGGLHLTAQQKLRQALRRLKVASVLRSKFLRNIFINSALDKLEEASSDMVAE